ncbi:hypothetical protein QBC43DRAFT_39616 [Cladorrhinum sp. PSN259]|nr:hypothetical protein QBC43DRAFT_39616 [Cladorrhinum sp. PSN259]
MDFCFIFFWFIKRVWETKNLLKYSMYILGIRLRVVSVILWIICQLCLFLRFEMKRFFIFHDFWHYLVLSYFTYPIYSGSVVIFFTGCHCLLICSSPLCCPLRKERGVYSLIKQYFIIT